MGAEPSIKYHIDRIGENYAYNPLFPNQRTELTSNEIRNLKLREADEGINFEELARAALREKHGSAYA